MIDRNYGDLARERRERAVRALEGEPPTSEAQPRRRMSGVRTRHYRCRWAVAESATPSLPSLCAQLMAAAGNVFGLFGPSSGSTDLRRIAAVCPRSAP